MGNHSICDSILTRAVLPLNDLLVNGVAHVELPASVIRLYSTGGYFENWMMTQNQDGGSMPVNTVLPSSAEFPRNFKWSRASVRRIEWEANNWHYDIREGLTTGGDEGTYQFQSTIGSEERRKFFDEQGNPHRWMITIPFPIDKQMPTVCVPWAGEFKDQKVQAPPGFATIFDPHACWHRGDRWMGSRRGVYLQNVEGIR